MPRKQKERKCLLVDGDISLFMSAFGNQHSIQWDEETESEYTNFQNATEVMDNTIRHAMKVSNCDEVVVALSCPPSTNFRYEVFPEYKANRKGKEKPTLYKPLREYLYHNYNYIIKPHLEADDVLGILATKYPDKYVIMSADKDLRQINGFHYDRKLDKVVKVPRPEANRFFYMQVLMGDTVDGYSGCPSIGKVKAAKIVDDNLGYGEDKMWKAIIETYATKGLDEAYALTMARVARILRAEDYDFERREIKLWQPKNIS